MASPSIFGVADFLTAFDAPSEDGKVIADLVEQCDFRYHPLEQAERDEVILSVLRKLGTFTQVGAHRHNIWEMAWSDVSRRYDKTSELSALVPTFIAATEYVRLRGDYVRPVDPAFELNYYRVLRHWLFHTYFRQPKYVYEFGCGSGALLAALAEWAPEKRLLGLDWAQSAVDMINRVASEHRFSLEARRFDFFNPDADLILEPDSVAITFDALEQTGERCTILLDWLLERKPGLVISMEPVLDFYNPDSLVDELAIRYHTGRKYLSGYLPWLREHEAAGRIELVKAHRLGMGNLYHEGYMLLAWRPL